MAASMINIDSIMNKAKGILKALKEKHPDLRGYLVFSSRFGQSNFKSGIDLFSEFPEMFEPPNLVEAIKKLNTERKSKKEIPIKRKEELEKEIGKLLPGLFIKDDVFVEIRFEQLNFELIEALKRDPLVSQDFTLQQKSSIRIVLFRINESEG